MERQRMIFTVSILSVILSVFFLGVYYFLSQWAFVQSIFNEIYELNPMSHLGLNKSLGIFFGAYILAVFLNLILPHYYILNAVVHRWADQYDTLFWHSVLEQDYRKRLLLVTTTTNKVYVGYVRSMGDPIGDPFVSLVPNLSGYRDPKTHELIITTDYIRVLTSFLEDDNFIEIEESLGVTILKSNILMVSKFNRALFNSFENKLQLEKEPFLDPV